MSNLEAKYIGNGLYQVFVDGKETGVPCEIDRIAMMYDDMVGGENNEDGHGNIRKRTNRIEIIAR